MIDSAEIVVVLPESLYPLDVLYERVRELVGGAGMGRFSTKRGIRSFTVQKSGMYGKDTNGYPIGTFHFRAGGPLGELEAFDGRCLGSYLQFSEYQGNGIKLRAKVNFPQFMHPDDRTCWLTPGQIQKALRLWRGMVNAILGVSKTYPASYHWHMMEMCWQLAVEHPAMADLGNILGRENPKMLGWSRCGQASANAMDNGIFRRVYNKEKEMFHGEHAHRYAYSATKRAEYKDLLRVEVVLKGTSAQKRAMHRIANLKDSTIHVDVWLELFQKWMPAFVALPGGRLHPEDRARLFAEHQHTTACLVSAALENPGLRLQMEDDIHDGRSLRAVWDTMREEQGNCRFTNGRLPLAPPKQAVFERIVAKKRLLRLSSEDLERLNEGGWDAYATEITKPEVLGGAVSADAGIL